MTSWGRIAIFCEYVPLAVMVPLRAVLLPAAHRASRWR